MPPDHPQCNNCGGTTEPAEYVGAYECTGCGSHTYIGIRNHAVEDRWPVRSSDVTYPIREAWDEGAPLENDEHSLYGDEVRYHHHTGTILLRRGTDIVTVIDITSSRPEIKYGALKAIARHQPHVLIDAHELMELTDHTLTDIADDVGINLDIVSSLTG